ncbi:MAG: methyltransferase domain-containing protein [Verrucomicrobiota bacterium]
MSRNASSSSQTIGPSPDGGEPPRNSDSPTHHVPRLSVVPVQPSNHAGVGVARLLEIEEEARAFDDRIEERAKAGFIPDLRRATRCEYFYKSFWRDPQFIRLYLGPVVGAYLELIGRHVGPRARILDIGCGAGYMALELARAGHDVKGIDIASSCIEIAERTLASNPYRDGFGSLCYQVASFEEVAGQYDVLLFSGCLHHLPDPDASIQTALPLLREGGVLLCWEPCHEEWRIDDAALVSLIRGMLSLSGLWYEDPAGLDIADDAGLRRFIGDVHQEYLHERDPHEARGQSPHDNESSGREILTALRRHFVELDYRPMTSFIYRLLGGLRGPQDTVARLADFLTSYDRLGIAEGFLRPNNFIFMGRKPA